MSDQATGDVVDIGLEETVEVKGGNVELAPTSGDRMLFAALLAGLTFLLLRRWQHRTTAIAVAAALGAFVLPKFLATVREESTGKERWALFNPFGRYGREPVAMLT